MLSGGEVQVLLLQHRPHDAGRSSGRRTEELRVSAEDRRRNDEKTTARLVDYLLIYLIIIFFFLKVLLSPDHRLRIGWGAISIALHIMKYIYILYNSLKSCIVYVRHIKCYFAEF